MVPILMKCNYQTSSHFLPWYPGTHSPSVPEGADSYTVLCRLSRLSPIASEEWGGKSINIPSESESADSSTCPIMVSGLDDSLGGVEDAPLLRSVIVVVASVPWRAPEEWRGRMEGDERGKSRAPAPAWTRPLNWDPTHSLLEEEADSSDPGTRSAKASPCSSRQVMISQAEWRRIPPLPTELASGSYSATGVSSRGIL